MRDFVVESNFTCLMLSSQGCNDRSCKSTLNLRNVRNGLFMTKLVERCHAVFNVIRSWECPCASLVGCAGRMGPVRLQMGRDCVRLLPPAGLEIAGLFGGGGGLRNEFCTWSKLGSRCECHWTAGCLHVWAGCLRLFGQGEGAVAEKLMVVWFETCCGKCSGCGGCGGGGIGADEICAEAGIEAGCGHDGERVHAAHLVWFGATQCRCSWLPPIARGQLAGKAKMSWLMILETDMDRWFVGQCLLDAPNFLMFVVGAGAFAIVDWVHVVGFQCCGRWSVLCKLGTLMLLDDKGGWNRKL